MKPNNTIREVLVAASLLTVAACGTVEMPEATDDDMPGSGSGMDAGSDSEPDSSSGSEPPPLPPVEVSGFDKGELFDWSFAADSPISRTFNPGKTALVYQRIIQNTADEVALSWSATRGKIFATASTVSDTFSIAGNNFPCAGSTDPVCTRNTSAPADPKDYPARRTDQYGPSLSVVLVDEATGDIVHTGAGLSINTVLPARASTAGSRVFRVVVMMGRVEYFSTVDGWYGAAPDFAEQTFEGQHFIGYKPHDEGARCLEWSDTTCSTYVRYWSITGLDTAKLEFEPIDATLWITGQPPATYSTGPMVWDAGDEDLPGPLH